VRHLARAQVDEHIVQVAVAEADDIADDGRDGGGAGVELRAPPPGGGRGRRAPQLLGQQVAGRLGEQRVQHLAQQGGRTGVAVVGEGARADQAGEAVLFQQGREFAVEEVAGTKDRGRLRLRLRLFGRLVDGFALLPFFVECEEGCGAFYP